jgi:hypothetical protein
MGGILRQEHKSPAAAKNIKTTEKKRDGARSGRRAGLVSTKSS